MITILFFLFSGKQSEKVLQQQQQYQKKIHNFFKLRLSVLNSVCSRIV